MKDIVTSLQDHNGQAIITATTFMVLTTIAVALRFLTALTTKAKFNWSEVSLLAAYGCFIAQYVAEMYGLLEGRQMKSLMDPRLGTYLKAIYIGGEFYFPLILFTNLSILLLYRRLFPVQEFKRWTNIFIIAHVVWFIPSLVAETLMCSPPSIFWEQPLLIPEKCFMYSDYFISVMTIELALDVAILILPLFYISKLHLSWARRAELMFIFLLGGLVLISGIVRIVVSTEVGVQAIEFVQDIIWINIHSGVAIICACLPTYRPLIVKANSILSNGMSKVFSSGAKSSLGASGGESSRNTGGKSSKSVDGTIGSPRYKKYNKFGSVDEVQLVGMDVSSAKGAV
ncbi:hypothetical protein DM02DRAFT_677177 [Periconia macrospinosa]|uniref:Rhodopsin domain-containing protein n=1 Tax=Periconia macrospinosa TaxID=97972 RepID=A0A2V1D4L7_9PLEO|nr:hypothetical protein DM02DRAFT_677177 [Periconia macrospinosa]